MERRFSISFQEIDQKCKRYYRCILYGALLTRLILFTLFCCSQLFKWESFRSVFRQAAIIFLLLAIDLLIRISGKGRQARVPMGFAEIFLFQVLTYRYAFFLPMEFTFVITVMIDICFACPLKTAVMLNSLLALVWMPLMSLTFYAPSTLSIVNSAIPLRAFGHCLYFTSALFSTMLSILLNQYALLSTLHVNESVTSHNLDVLNRSLTTRLFSAQAEAEQKAKREVTKYVHDNTGYVFVNLIMMLQAAEAVFENDVERGKTMLADCINYACQGMDEIRRVLRQEKESRSEYLNIQTEIFNLARLFERCTGIEISVIFGEWPERFSPQIDSFFLSFVKEGLTNAVKHGMATKIHISCNQDTRGQYSLSIHDNGVFQGEKITYGLGLQGIQDALNALNGALIVSHDGSGFMVRASLRYPPN